MSVAILCPTRDRPKELMSMIESVRKTSDATVLVWIDQDQRYRYPVEPPDWWERLGARVKYGERIGPVAAANALVSENQDFDAYGFVTDNSTLTSKNWDSWLLGAIQALPGGLAVVSPWHDQGEHVDMPFVSRDWVNLVGWYACPECRQYCWPTVTGLIGEMTAICHAPKQCFGLVHDYVGGYVSQSGKILTRNQETRDRDALKFYDFVAHQLSGIVDKLRHAMQPGVA